MNSNSLLDLIKQRKAATAGRRKTIKPEAGRNRYRILPGWREGDPTFWHDFGAHYIKGHDQQIKAVHICLDKTFGRPCDVCTAIEKAIMSTADDATLKLLKDAKSTGRVLLNVLHIDGDKPTEPQILEVAPSVFNGKKGVGGVISLFDEWPTMMNLADGHDIIVERQGTGLDTSYGVQIAGGSKPVSPDIMKKIANLDEFVAQESTEAHQRALSNIAQVAGLLPPPPISTGAPVTGAWSNAGATTSAATPKSVEQPPVDLNTVAPVDVQQPVAATTATPAPAAIAQPSTPAPAATTAPEDDPELAQILKALEAAG